MLMQQTDPTRASALKRIAVLVPSDRARAWSAALAGRLCSRLGMAVDLLRVVGIAGRSPSGIETVERPFFRRRRDPNSAWIETRDAPAAAALVWSDSLLINATEHPPEDLPAELLANATVVTPLYEGGFTIEGIMPSLVGSGPPHLAVLVSDRGVMRVASGTRVAIPDRDVFSRAIDVIYARAMLLLQITVERLLSGEALACGDALPATTARQGRPRFWAGRAAATCLRRGVRRFGRPLLGREQWYVAYRVLRDRDQDPFDLGGDRFRILQPAPARYYADPMIFRHAGVTVLFFEDFQFSTGVAGISHVVLRDDGTHSDPVPTIIRPYHLSYPFVFEHGGRVFMIPESSANRTIELYECERFPDQWRLRKVLLDDIEAADVTLYRAPQSGLWWMFTTVTVAGSSSWDSLWLFFSRELEGPWQAHPANPVKLDPLSSRPAGPLLEWQGRLLRPAQSCGREYGEGLTWCEITRLDPHLFEETPTALLLPPSGFSGLHTYCRSAGYEAIDLKRTPNWF